MNSEHDLVAWEDIDAAARRMFEVWTGSLELGWAKECWVHLRAANLTQGSTDLERTATHLRLLTLAVVYREFSQIAWDEGEAPVAYLAEDLHLDPLSLGYLAGKEDPTALWGCCDTDDVWTTALTAATNAMRRVLFGVLVRAFGSEARLYIRMRMTHEPDEELPAPGVRLSDLPEAPELDFVASAFDSTK